MANISETGACPEKTNRIIEAAQKRFGQYGYEKTAMHEIASDLNMSKGSLYYYFPDKEGLYLAVVEKEHEQFINIVKEKIASLSDPSQMIREYVNMRIFYFQSLLNLSRFRHNDTMRELHTLLHKKFAFFKLEEEALITEILNEGIKQGIYEIKTPTANAELLLDVIKGLSILVLKHKDIFCIEPHEANTLTEKINLFIEIFIKSQEKR